MRALFIGGVVDNSEMDLDGNQPPVHYPENSGSGRPRYRGYLPYYVAKRGAAALGEALGLELAAYGIRVHVVAPGPIVPAAGSTPKDEAAVLKATPLGHWGGEDEVAGRVVGLLGSTFVTGEAVRIDGGRHLG